MKVLNRFCSCCLLTAVAIISSDAAADDFKLLNGEQYKNVKVIRVEPDGVMVATNYGIIKLLFTELPKPVQEKYHYDPKKAEAFRFRLDAARDAAAEAKAAPEGRAQDANPNSVPDALPAPTPATTASPTAAPENSASPSATKAATQAGQPLTSDILNAVVTISGREGAGTGFICNFRGKSYVVTNQHVLTAGDPIYVRTRRGDSLVAQRFFAAADADVALIECSIPQGVTPLEIATMPDSSIVSGDPVVIPGNSKGDGVITETNGKLLAIGAQRIEVDNPVYPGNSGSPIFHFGSHKVIGVLTEAELLKLNDFDKASFRSKNSAIKSEIRYFGHRIDSVQKWDLLDWRQFQQTELLIRQSRQELDDIFAYFTNSSDRYKELRELHIARNNAAIIYNDKNHSKEDKAAALDRFLRDIDWIARRAEERVGNRKICYCQRHDVETIFKMAEVVSSGTAIAKRDNEISIALLQRGN